jgi:RNA polymerase sigma factor (TIGR02999 family)
MSDATRLLAAAARLAEERPGQTLQPSALVHEAYVRLVGGGAPRDWNGRRHFFGVVAEAMRRILADPPRRKQANRRGGRGSRDPLDADIGLASPEAELLDIDEDLTRLAAEDAQAARLIQLRYFGGLSIEGADEVVDRSRSTAYEFWSYARVRLRILLDGE